MKSMRFYLKTLFCLLTVGFSGLAAAGSVYGPSTGLSFTPGALSNNGAVVGGTISSSGILPTGCTGSNCHSLVTYDYYLTGNNATNAQQISTFTMYEGSSTSQHTTPSGDYAISTNNFGWNLSAPVETGPVNPIPSSCGSGCSITAPVMSFVGVNDNGIIVGNADFIGSDVPLQGTYGSVVNTAADTMTLVNGAVTGLSSTNFVSLNGPSNTFPGVARLLTPSNQLVTTTDLGYGSVSYGVNATGQLVGAAMTGAQIPYGTPTWWRCRYPRKLL